jgi:hypothetical protein
MTTDYEEDPIDKLIDQLEEARKESLDNGDDPLRLPEYVCEWLIKTYPETPMNEFLGNIADRLREKPQS